MVGSNPKKIMIIGGGAAGFFAAIKAAETARESGKSVQIVILEMSRDYLKKVRISGGGRCNVTHHLFETRPFCAHYPRGEKELLSAMQRFQAKDTVEWFAHHGVRLVPEKDGRMFPDTNSSQTIIDCFLQATRDLNIEIRTGQCVQTLEKNQAGEFVLGFSSQDPLTADSVMIATGS